MNAASQFADLLGAFSRRNVDLKGLRRLARALQKLRDSSLRIEARLQSIRDLHQEVWDRSNKDSLKRNALWKDEITYFRDGAPIFEDRVLSELEINLGLESEQTIDWPAVDRAIIAFDRIAVAEPSSNELSDAVDAGLALVQEIFDRDNVDYLKRFTPWSDEQEFGYDS
jgi:hypothetical protein